VKRFKVSIHKEAGVTGVGIERYRTENGQGVVEFIMSYYLGASSRQDAVRSYIREIQKQLEPGEPALIRIGDPNLYGKDWLSIYPKHIRFSIEHKTRFKTCRALAEDAVRRKSSVMEELEI